MTIRQEHDWRWWGALAFAAAAGFGVIFMLTGAAQTNNETPIIDVPITSRFIGEPGSIHVVHTVPADPGLDCDIALSFFNNDGQSIHPGNDILVGPTVFADVESGSFVSPSSRQFESGGDIVIAVRLGAPDGWFSGGFVVTGGCDLPPVEPPPTTTSTTLAPPEQSTTTSTEPPPVGGVPTGGGACEPRSVCEPAMSWPITALSVAGVFLLVGVTFRAWLKYGGNR